MRHSKQASLPLYIRFGKLPKDENSAVHRSDDIIRNEGGVSVWRAVEDQGKYWPLLPDDYNDNTIADYFHMLVNLYGSGNGPVYLVIGDEIGIEGASREPLLRNVKIIKDISHYYNTESYNKKNKERIEKDLLNDLMKYGIITKDDLKKYNKMKEENKQKEGENVTD